MLDDKEDEEWNKLELSVYKEAERCASIVGIKISAPRQVSHHIQGISYNQLGVESSYMNENLQINSPEDYFKFSIWYPYLTSVITTLKRDFQNNRDPHLDYSNFEFNIN